MAYHRVMGLLNCKFDSLLWPDQLTGYRDSSA
jgi:hypothetical protein